MGYKNNNGMHYVSYHRRNCEFDEDTKFAIKFATRSKNYIKPQDTNEIIKYKGKLYQVIEVDENGNKTIAPCKRKKK